MSAPPLCPMTVYPSPMIKTSPTPFGFALAATLASCGSMATNSPQAPAASTTVAQSEPVQVTTVPTDTITLGSPEELLTDNNPFTRQSYPSPVLYDLDGDGQSELIVGDLPGRMRYSQKGQTDLAWSKMKPMKADGEPLRLNNW